MLTDNGRPIRSVAELIGLIVTSFTVAEYDRLHFGQLEANKVCSLKGPVVDFDSGCYLSDEAKSEITWWIDNVASVSQRIDHGNWIFALSTDASENGWGQSWKLSIPIIGNYLQSIQFNSFYFESVSM